MKNFVIFDMDGVLVDSEPIHMEILNEVLSMKGVSVSLEYYFSLVGMGGLLIWEKLKQDYNLAGSPENLFKDHKTYFYSVIEEKKIVAVHGVSDVLKQLKENEYNISLGSSSPERLINHSLKAVGFTHFFDHKVSSEHVSKGKPFPDIFLRVAELYNEKPERFIVIEDSKNGVLAAKEAGMTCIGFKNPNSGDQDLSKADVIIDDFEEFSVKRINELLS